MLPYVAPSSGSTWCPAQLSPPVAAVPGTGAFHSPLCPYCRAELVQPSALLYAPTVPSYRGHSGVGRGEEQQDAVSRVNARGVAMSTGSSSTGVMVHALSPSLAPSRPVSTSLVYMPLPTSSTCRTLFLADLPAQVRHRTQLTPYIPSDGLLGLRVKFIHGTTPRSVAFAEYDSQQSAFSALEWFLHIELLRSYTVAGGEAYLLASGHGVCEPSSEHDADPATSPPTRSTRTGWWVRDSFAPPPLVARDLVPQRPLRSTHDLPLPPYRPFGEYANHPEYFAATMLRSVKLSVEWATSAPTTRAAPPTEHTDVAPAQATLPSKITVGDTTTTAPHATQTPYNALAFPYAGPHEGQRVGSEYVESTTPALPYTERGMYGCPHGYDGANAMPYLPPQPGYDPRVPSRTLFLRLSRALALRRVSGETTPTVPHAVGESPRELDRHTRPHAATAGTDDCSPHEDEAVVEARELLQEAFLRDHFAGVELVTPFDRGGLDQGCFVRFASHDEAVGCLRWMREHTRASVLLNVDFARQDSFSSPPLVASKQGGLQRHPTRHDNLT